MPQATIWASCCWPVSSQHVYNPISTNSPDVVKGHYFVWQTSTCHISPTARRLACVSVQYSLIAFVVLISVLYVGAEYEQYQVRNADSTTNFYSQPEVCGILLSQQANITSTNETASTRDVASGVIPEASIRIATFGSVGKVAAANSSSTMSIVAHCGDCGACSTPQDISIYDDTRNTLFKSTASCAKRSLLGGRRTAAKCMLDEVGLTSDCNDCWVENIMCDLRKCIFTCLWYGLHKQVDGGAGTGTTLNACTECDEKRCGPAFVTCAGANRRRSGIITDIKRNEHSEVCHDVTPEWWKDQDLVRQWRAHQPVTDDSSSRDTPRLRPWLPT
jgi:hypothetical protein